MAHQVKVEGPPSAALSGQVQVKADGSGLVVEAQHGGILKLRFTNGGRVIPAQRAITVRPWQHHSLEGAMFSVDSGDTMQLKETGLLSNYTFEHGDLALSFSDEALNAFARGGVLTLIDYYRG